MTPPSLTPRGRRRDVWRQAAVSHGASASWDLASSGKNTFISAYYIKLQNDPQLHSIHITLDRIKLSFWKHFLVATLLFIVLLSPCNDD